MSIVCSSLSATATPLAAIPSAAHAWVSPYTTQVPPGQCPHPNRMNLLHVRLWVSQSLNLVQWNTCQKCNSVLPNSHYEESQAYFWGFLMQIHTKALQFMLCHKKGVVRVNFVLCWPSLTCLPMCRRQTSLLRLCTLPLHNVVMKGEN